MTRLLALALFILGRWRVLGAEKTPRSGGLIVVANHLNFIDPPLLAASLPRRIHFMAKQELFDARSGVFVRLYGAFPVRRFEADLQALRTARKLLQDGEVVGMFPEGHRSGGEMIAAHPGTALLALQSGSPVLPVAITGSEQIRIPGALFRRPRVTVRVGEPFVMAREHRIDSVAIEQASIRIMRHIAELLPPRYRGVYTYDEVQ